MLLRRGEERLELEGRYFFVVLSFQREFTKGLASVKDVLSRFRKEDERLELEEDLEVQYF